MKTNPDQLEQAIAAAFSSVQDVFDLIDQQLDGPFEMRIGLKKVVMRLKSADHEASLLRDTVDDLTRLVDSLVDQRKQLIRERDAAYTEGWNDGVHGVAAWRRIIAALSE